MASAFPCILFFIIMKVLFSFDAYIVRWKDTCHVDIGKWHNNGVENTLLIQTLRRTLRTESIFYIPILLKMKYLFFIFFVQLKWRYEDLSNIFIYIHILVYFLTVNNGFRLGFILFYRTYSMMYPFVNLFTLLFIVHWLVFIQLSTIVSISPFICFPSTLSNKMCKQVDNP